MKQFNRLMNRWLFVWLAFAFAAQLPRPAAAQSLQYRMLENDVVYLRVGDAGKSLADEITAAESALAVSNKTSVPCWIYARPVATVSPRRSRRRIMFADRKLPLAILVNGQTRGAAATLAVELREARDGLDFRRRDAGVASGHRRGRQNRRTSGISAESLRGLPPTNNPAGDAATTNFVPFIDHTSEADLVREKIKDGDEDEDSPPPVRAEPQKPVIRDPVLARAVDLIKALAVVQPVARADFGLTTGRSTNHLEPSRGMKTILFICTGNVCRSPMAEALFRHAVRGRGDFRVLSAGIGAMDGQPPTPHSVRGHARTGH